MHSIAQIRSRSIGILVDFLSSAMFARKFARFHQEVAVAQSFSGKHYDDDDAFEDDDGEAYEDEDEPPATDHKEEHLVGRMADFVRATGQWTVISTFQYLDSYRFAFKLYPHDSS